MITSPALAITSQKSRQSSSADIAGIAYAIQNNAIIKFFIATPLRLLLLGSYLLTMQWVIAAGQDPTVSIGIVWQTLNRDGIECPATELGTSL